MESQKLVSHEMESHRSPPVPSSTTSASTQRPTKFARMPWLRSQGPLPGTTIAGSTSGSLKAEPTKVGGSPAKPVVVRIPVGRTSSSRRLKAHTSRAPPKPVRSSLSSTVMPKEEPLDADAMLRCGTLLEALEKELLSVKDWGSEEYNLRKHKLVEKTVEAATACNVYGGWEKISQSPLIETWMAEIARYRASPTAELDMSVFNKPPFAEEPIAVQLEHPPTPPRTPSVSPIKSALKRRASDSLLQATNTVNTPSTKRSKTTTTPSSLRGLPSTRTLPTGRVCPSRENATRRLSSRKIKQEEMQSNPGFAAFEAAILGTQTAPSSMSTPKRTLPRVKFILPEPPSPDTSKADKAADPTRSVKRIREGQKERRAAQKAALDDIPKLREENSELKKTVADLMHTVKTQSEIIRAVQEEQAKLRDKMDNWGAGGVAALEARVDELEMGGAGTKGTQGTSATRPDAMGRAVEEALKKHREAMNPQFVSGLEDMRGQLRGLKASLEHYQHAQTNALRLR